MNKTEYFKILSRFVGNKNDSGLKSLAQLEDETSTYYKLSHSGVVSGFRYTTPQSFTVIFLLLKFF